MISKEDAINIAKQLAQDLSWIWVEPTEVILRRSWFGKPLRYEIFSNPIKLGSKARVFIDANTGEIIEKGYIPR